METLITAALVVFGFFIGASDAVSGGGNLFVVSLLGIAGLSPLRAIASMQVVTLVQDIVASLVFNKEKLVNWKQALWFVPFAMGGSFIGANVAIRINEQSLAYIVGVLMIGLLFLIPQIKEKKPTFPERIESLIAKVKDERPLVADTKKQIVLLVILSLLLGFYGGFYGGAVGILMLIAFFLIGKADFLTTIATTKVIGISMSLTASYVYFSQPDLINWQYAFPLILGVTVGVFSGISWAKKFGYRYVRMLLYIAVIASAVKFFFF